MTPIAVGTTVTVLAVIGLVIGLVVLAVVISLLNGVLRPLRRIQADLQSARGAPMIERGVPGTDQLGQTRRLAESVPDLALAYLQKLSLPASSEAPAPAPAPARASAPAPAVETRAPAQTQAPPAEQDDASLPGWKRYRG
jgi:hypothetical protein